MGEKNLSLYGTGEDQRAFTFVEDLNQILKTFIDRKDIKSSIFSSNEVYTIKEISALVSKKLSFKGELNFTGESTAGQKRKVASSFYLQSKVPGLKFTNLEKGLAKVIDWYVGSI